MSLEIQQLIEALNKKSKLNNDTCKKILEKNSFNLEKSIEYLESEYNYELETKDKKDKKLQYSCVVHLEKEKKLILFRTETGILSYLEEFEKFVEDTVNKIKEKEDITNIVNRNIFIFSENIKVEIKELEGNYWYYKLFDKRKTNREIYDIGIFIKIDKEEEDLGSFLVYTAYITNTKDLNDRFYNFILEKESVKEVLTNENAKILEYINTEKKN